MTVLDAVAALLYDGPWVAERWVAVKSLIETDPQAMDPTVASVIGQARRYTAADAFSGQQRLAQLRQDAARLWHDVDLLLVPTAPRHPTLAEVAADPVGANAALGRYTNFVNLLGWSAVAVPAGFTRVGLPFGVTGIAPGGADVALLQWASAWVAASDAPLGATGRIPRRGDDLPGLPPAPRPATEAVLPIVAVGAHLSGLPLNGQLTERGGYRMAVTRTAPSYRLFALPGTVPPKPGLVRVAAGGAAIDVEVWALPQSQVGSFLAGVPSPLGLGQIELADGSRVHGFLCESAALDGARDITEFGGWRAYLAQR
jgi:allophanate hydrolase